MRLHGILAIVVAAIVTLPAPSATQGSATAADEEWDAPAVVELLERARERRHLAFSAEGLQNYQADARGRVYFFLDLTETDERVLVRTDQLALETTWMAPALTRQRIVGRRSENELPTPRLRYYTDRLVTVMDNFGDRIVIADGDNVRDVTHPVAPDGADEYEYRMAGTVTLRLPGAPEPIRVTEVEVRPRDPSRPAFVGSVFLDRDAADIVRMDFTFTPASYTDPQVDRIDISLEHGLWEGRYWLPYEQRLEVRRELRGLDLPAGSVIRARMRVSNYRFNQDLSPAVFAGPPVIMVPEEEQQAFPFEEPLDAELRDEGLAGTDADLRELRSRARELARQRTLSGLGRARVHFPSASDLLRFNRAEGLAVGLGGSVRAGPRLTTRLHGGWAFGAGHPWGRVELAGPDRGVRWHAGGFWNRPRDAGVGPVASGAANSLLGVIAGQDFSDPYYARGGELGIRAPLGAGWSTHGMLRGEHHRSATLEQTDAPLTGVEFRPVAGIDRGTLGSVTAGLRRQGARQAARWWSSDIAVETGGFNAVAGNASIFMSPVVQATRGWRWSRRRSEVELSGRAGALFGDPPAQLHFLLGGRGTVPGYRLRSFGGDRFAAATLASAVDLWEPWVRGRAQASAGWVGATDSALGSVARFGAAPTGGVRTSVGAGVGLFWDILRLDVARGLDDDGRWEVILETRPSFWPFL